MVRNSQVHIATNSGITEVHLLGDELLLVGWLVGCYVTFQSLPMKPRGHAVAKLVEALYYKPEGRGFESR
jgi:hypothetical protein